MPETSPSFAAPVSSTAAGAPSRAAAPEPAGAASVPSRGGGVPPGTPLSEAIRRGVLFSEQCPSRDVLKHVTSRWGVLVLVALLSGTHRFSELRRKIGGVSERMLAQTLQWLEGDGFVDRLAYPVVPPHVEYSLTPMGREVAERVEGLADWIEGNIGRILAARETEPICGTHMDAHMDA